VPISLEAKEAMCGMGLSEWKAEVLIEYARAHSQGHSNFTTEDIEQLTGQIATSYRKFVTDFERALGGALPEWAIVDAVVPGNRKRSRIGRPNVRESSRVQPAQCGLTRNSEEPQNEADVRVILIPF